MFRLITSDSTDSDVFNVERSSGDYSSTRIFTPDIFNSTELSGAHAAEVIKFSPVASREPQMVTIESVSKQPTIPYGYERQQTVIPPSFNDLNLPMNPFIIITIVSPAATTEAQQYSTHLMTARRFRKKIDFLDILIPPMEITTVDDWLSSIFRCVNVGVGWTTQYIYCL